MAFLHAAVFFCTYLCHKFSSHKNKLASQSEKGDPSASISKSDLYPSLAENQVTTGKTRCIESKKNSKEIKNTYINIVRNQ